MTFSLRSGCWGRLAGRINSNPQDRSDRRAWASLQDIGHEITLQIPHRFRRCGVRGLEVWVVGESEEFEQCRVDEGADGGDASGRDVEDVDGERGRWASGCFGCVDRDGR